MPKYKVTLGDKSYIVEIVNPRERPVRAVVDGQEYKVDIQEQSDAQMPVVTAPVAVVEGAAPGVIPAAAPAPTATGEVRAPLPGTIVSIAVKVGDRVEYGQELCVLEAMKMNNPIRATGSGTVQAVHVQVGTSVQYGDLLITLA